LLTADCRFIVRLRIADWGIHCGNESPNARISNHPMSRSISNRQSAMDGILLASASPRRAQLLRAIGVAFDSIAAEVDETPQPDEAPEPYVQRLALAKARAVASRRPGQLVLGADTTVAVDGDILGKAASEREAAQMLERLAGRAHEVHTGVALVDSRGSAVACATTRVWFDAMTSGDIQAYLASGEWRDKAGAYGIQGRISRFVARVDGSYTNVVGLPVALVWALLMRYPDGRGRDRSQP
jgi:septum formation protein